MWFIIFIAYAAATALVRLPEICLHDSTNTISAPRNVKTDVTNHLSENSDHKIDFAKPKILGTARNRTKLFILETLTLCLPKKFHANCTIGVQLTPDFKKVLGHKDLTQINKLTSKTVKNEQLNTKTSNKRKKIQKCAN